MAESRKLWTEPFRLHMAPLWPCPSCLEGRLVLVKDTMRQAEEAASREARQHFAWDPDWVAGVFTCHLRCNNPRCKEWVVCCGRYRNVEDSNEAGEPCYPSEFRPTYFQPAPPVFSMPNDCLEEIGEAVRAAFAVAWSDPFSAANRIRTSLERILDSAKIPRSTRKNGRQSRHSLHARIEMLGRKLNDKELHSMMMAVKWLSNAGSHGADLSVDALFDGFDLLEHVLRRQYDRSEAELLRKSKAINRRKGPVKRSSGQ